MFNLIIVESPEKAKVISKFLDNTFKVVACKGHVLDLPTGEYGVSNSDNKFSGNFIPSSDAAKKTIADIKALSLQATIVFLATDDDREGERIANDLVELCALKNYHRVVFHEISKKEVLSSLKNPREIDQAKLSGQKARRLIDRIVGYPGSTAIAQDFKNLGLEYEPSGIGRSIAPALRLLCQVEENIQSFEDNPPEQKTLLRVRLEKNNVQFIAKFAHLYSQNELNELDMIISMIRRSSAYVMDYQPEMKHVNPPKPLNTSFYQFGCFYLFGLMPKKAMEIAQNLYQLGFISYMRTDSCRVPLEKAIEMQQVIRAEFGDEYYAEAPRLYTEQDAKVQDAHPAILPTSFELSHFPKNIEELWKSDPMFSKLLSSENYFKVYQFIFLRGIASQMAPARFSVAKGSIEIAGMQFLAKEHMRHFDGWQKLSRIIQEQSDEASKEFISAEEESVLPELEMGEQLKVERVYAVEVPNQRPRRYGVGRFVSTLFKLGIVRPSTMDKIVEKLMEKNYVEIEAKIVVPTKLGRKVDAWLGLEFPEINNIEKAKEFEDRLENAVLKKKPMR